MSQKSDPCMSHICLLTVSTKARKMDSSHTETFKRIGWIHIRRYQFTILTLKSFKDFTYQPSPASPFPSHIILIAVSGCKCCNHLRISPSQHDFKNAVRLKKKQKKRMSGRRLERLENRWERERKQRKNEFLPGRWYGQVTRAVMEVDIACFPISDLPIRPACLFRGRQIRTPRWDNSLCQVVKLIHPCGRQMCETRAEQQQSSRAVECYLMIVEN